MDKSIDHNFETISELDSLQGSNFQTINLEEAVVFPTAHDVLQEIENKKVAKKMNILRERIEAAGYFETPADELLEYLGDAAELFYTPEMLSDIRKKARNGENIVFLSPSKERAVLDEGSTLYGWYLDGELAEKLNQDIQPMQKNSVELEDLKKQYLWKANFFMQVANTQDKDKFLKKIEQWFDEEIETRISEETQPKKEAEDYANSVRGKFNNFLGLKRRK